MIANNKDTIHIRQGKVYMHAFFFASLIEFSQLTDRLDWLATPTLSTTTTKS